MALTQISTAGVKDDAVTSGKIPANAVGSSEIADQAVTLAKLPHGTSSNNGKFLRANNGADPTFETVSTDLVADTSPQLGGDLASNSNDILIADSDKIKCGNSSDFEIFHNGASNNTEVNHINNGSHLQITSNRLKLMNYDGPETYIDCISNGAVELYHNNSKKFETTSTGVQVIGNIDIDGNIDAADGSKLKLGTGDDFQIHHDGTKNLIETHNGEIHINKDSTEFLAKFIPDGAVELYHNNAKRFETTSIGTLTSGVLQVTDATSADAGNRISVGTSQDIRIFHIAGNDSYIRNYTGDTYLQGNNAGSIVNNIVFQNGNGATEVYYNNNKVVETKDLSGSGDSGELGLKFVNNKAIQFHNNQLGIFTATFSMNANTWTTMFTHDSYMAVTINVSSVHNAGFSSATWIVSKSASGGNSLVRTGLNDAYGPARLETRINGSDFQIRSSYGTYGYLLCLVQYNMDAIRSING